MAHRFRPFRWQKGQLRLMLEALTAPAADRPRWLTLLLWLGIPTMLLVPIGVSFWAVTDLSRLPALPQCFAVSWSDDNSSARLYCAKISADRHTPQDLQRALTLVSRIPRTDPLRLDTDRRIRQWSEELLQLGEAKYQEGDLDGAIEIAEKIPQAAQTRRSADNRIQQWKDTWDKAKVLSDDAKERLKDKDWYGVIATARQLLNLGNRYWATTQYEDLMQQLQAAKNEDKSKEDKNKEENSKNKLRATGNRPTATPGEQTFLSQLQQNQDTDARTRLNRAKGLADTGTPKALQSAIDEAQQIIFGSPGYDEAQASIDRWRNQLELSEDQPVLDYAISLASKGDEASLQSAITAASQIGWGRGLYDQANSRVEEWRDRIFQLQSETRTRQLEEMERNRSGSNSTHQPALRSAPYFAPRTVPQSFPENSPKSDQSNLSRFNRSTVPLNAPSSP